MTEEVSVEIGAIDIVPRANYVTVTLKPNDSTEISLISAAYGVPRAEIIRHMLTRLLRVMDRQHVIPLVLVDPSAIDFVDRKQMKRWNFGPTIFQHKRLKEVSEEFDLSSNYILVLAIRLGIAAYKRGEFTLQKAYIYNESRERNNEAFQL